MEERDHAERACLRFYTENATAPDWFAGRYDEILAKHGAPIPLADVDLAPPTHVKLNVRLEVEDSSVPLLIPVDLKPLQVAQFVADALGFDKAIAPKLSLRLVDTVAVSMGHYGITPLRSDKPLYSYKIHDDDDLIVDWR